MPFSDRNHYRIGDRVKDRHTSEQGRVTDLSLLPDGAILLTVSFFVHGLLTKRVQEKFRQGQRGGFRFDVLFTRGEGTAQEAANTTLRAGHISGQAVERARHDIGPGQRKVSVVDHTHQRVVRIMTGEGEPSKYRTPDSVGRSPHPGGLRAPEGIIRDRDPLVTQAHLEQLRELNARRRRLTAHLEAIGDPRLRQTPRWFPDLEAKKTFLAQATFDRPLDASLILDPAASMRIGGMGQVSESLRAHQQLTGRINELHDALPSRLKGVRGVSDLLPHNMPRPGREGLLDMPANTAGSVRGMPRATAQGSVDIPGMPRAAAIDVEGRYNSIHDALRQTRAVRDELTREAARLRQLVGYATKTSPNAAGEFAGRYVYDIALEKADLIPTARLEYGAQVEEYLRGIPLPPGFVTASQGLLPNNATTAFDILAQARLQAGRQERKAAVAIWKPYGGLIDQAVNQASHTQLLPRALRVLRHRIDRLDRERTDLFNTGFADATHLQAADPAGGRGEEGRTEAELLARSETHWHGQVPPELDQTALGIHLAEQRSKGQAAEIGVRRVSGRRFRSGVNLNDFFDPAKVVAARRQVYRLNGQTVRLGEVDMQTRRVAFHPLAVEMELYGPSFFSDPHAQLALAREVELGPGFAARSAVEQEARQLGRFAARQTIGVRGGLTGHAPGVVEIPVPVVAGYFSGRPVGSATELYQQFFGHDPAKLYERGFGHYEGPAFLAAGQRQELLGRLKSLGFHSEFEYSERAAAHAARFQSFLHTTLPGDALTQLGQDYTIQEAYNAANIAAFARLRSVADGLSMGELEATLHGHATSEVAALLNAHREHALTTTAFSRLDPPKGLTEKMAGKGQEPLSPEEVVDTLRPRSLTPVHTESAVSVRGFQTDLELRESLLEFRERVQQAAQALDPGALGSATDPKRLARAKGPIFETLFGERGGHDLAARLAEREQLATQAYYLSGHLPAHGVVDREMRIALSDFADAMGWKMIGTEGTGLSEAFQQYRRAQRAFGSMDSRTAGFAEAYENLKAELAFNAMQAKQLRAYERATLGQGGTELAERIAVGQQAAQARTVAAAWQDQLAAAFGIDPVPVPAPVATAYSTRMTPEMTTQLNIAIRAAEGGDFSPLHRVRADVHLGRGGKVGVRLYGGAERTGGTFIYYPAGEQGGLATSQADRSVQQPFGLPERYDLTQAQLAQHGERGTLVPLTRSRYQDGQTHQLPVELGEAVSAQRQAVTAELKRHGEQFATRTDVAELPIFRAADGTIIGSTEQGLVRTESVIQRTLGVLKRNDLFINLDIETNRWTRELLQVSAQRYEWQGGRHVPVGEALDIASPGWTGGASREVLADESSLLQRTAAFLGAHPDTTVAGHHLTFDVVTLEQRAAALGMIEAQPVLAAAQQRVADSLVAYQAGHPGLASYSQEQLAAKFLGETESEAHVAFLDQAQNVRLWGAAPRDAPTLERLATAERQSLTPGQLLLDTQYGRAFRVGGIIDPRRLDQARDALGPEAQVEFGLILNPIDFRTGETVMGIPRIERGGVAHGMAQYTMAKYQPTTDAALPGQLETIVKDTARRRVRRLLEPVDGFTTLMKERERLQLAQAPDLDTARTALLNRFAAAASPAERETLQKTLHWSRYLEGAHDPGGPGRMVEQAKSLGPFMQQEVEGAHRPIVAWLQAHLNAASQEGLATAQAQANAVWADYMQRTQGLVPFPAVTEQPIPLRKQGLSVKVPLLGENAYRINTGAPEMVRSSMERLTHRVAVALPEEELTRVIAGTPAAEQADLLSRLAQTRKSLQEGKIAKPILGSAAGERLREHIWQQHLQPAFAAGMTQRDAAGAPIRITAGSMDDAVARLMNAGAAHAEQTVKSYTDVLTPRAFDPAQLSGLQGAVMNQKSVAQAAEGLTDASRLVASLQQGAPQEWVGQDLAGIIQQGEQLTGKAAKTNFRRTLSGMRARMARGEQALLDATMTAHGAKWWEAAGKGPNVFTGPVQADAAASTAGAGFASASRKFRPGLANTAGLDLGEHLARGGGALRAAGVAALALGIGTLAVAALRSPRDTPPPDGPEGRDAGTQSSPTQARWRRERIQQDQSVGSRIRVAITGEDAAGLDHRELTVSVHAALGAFMGKEIGHEPRVTDRQQKVDREYLDRLAARLLKRDRSS